MKKTLSLGRAPGPGHPRLLGLLEAHLPVAFSGAGGPFLQLFWSKFHQLGIPPQVRVLAGRFMITLAWPFGCFPGLTIHVLPLFTAPREPGKKMINPWVHGGTAPNTKCECTANKERKSIAFWWPLVVNQSVLQISSYINPKQGFLAEKQYLQIDKVLILNHKKKPLLYPTFSLSWHSHGTQVNIPWVGRDFFLK